MKYTFLSLPVAAFVLTAALLFSSTLPAYATDGLNPTIDNNAVKTIKQKLAGGNVDATLGLADTASGTLPLGGTPNIDVNCDYSVGQPGPGQTVLFKYSAVFLGYKFFNGRNSSPISPYSLCQQVKVYACDFIHNTIGVPLPITATFHGNVIQGVSACQ